MNRYKVSIITVCFNSEKLIAKTIESVLNQTYDNIEYIIIDGKSTDNTLNVIKSYKDKILKKGYGFKVISEADEGIYDAMNKGVNLADGDLIGLINSGDWYEPNAVDCMIENYKKESFDLFYADLRIWRKGHEMIKKARFRKYATTRDWNHPTTFITHETYQHFQYACRGLYDDWDLILKIRNSGRKVSVCNETLANFCFGGISNRKDVKAAYSRMREKYRIYRENGYSRIYLLECVLMETVKYLAA